MVDWEPEIHGDVLYAIKLCVFGVALLASAWILNKIGGSGLLGYLFAGLVFGPKVLDFVPETDALRDHTLAIVAVSQHSAFAKIQPVRVFVLLLAIATVATRQASIGVKRQN